VTDPRSTDSGRIPDPAPNHAPESWRARFLTWMYPGKGWGSEWGPGTFKSDAPPQGKAKPTPGKPASRS